MWKARSIPNGGDTPCLFLCVTHENLVCIVGHLFYRNAFGIIGIINSNMSISLCLKKRGILMFEMKEYVSIFQRNGVKEAEHYRMDNAPKKIYKFIPFFDNGNSKVNKRNIETIEEKKVWASKYFSLNDPFEFNGMYLDEEKISASGNDVGTFYEYWKYITDCFITISFCAEKENLHPLNNMPMWAYYANNHHGICVEYDVCNPICLYPVSYEQERNPMSVVLGNFVALSLDAVNGKISGQNPELLKYQFLILNLMCVKHRSWKQENEFRILFPYPRLRENGKRVDLKDIGLEISAIYLGKDCSIRKQNRLKGVSINLGIDLYKMRVNNQSRKFDMCFDRIQ